MATSFDEYSKSLIEKSKRFLEKATEAKDALERQTYLHSALVHAFFFLESQVNSIADDFLYSPDLSVLDQSVLLEKNFAVENGEFVLTSQKFLPVTERVEFIARRFGKKRVDKQQQWWQDLKKGQRLRNSIVHPREQVELGPAAVKSSIRAVLAAVNFLYQSVYKKDFPHFSLDLKSIYEF